jgi:predicted metal-dependent hydrolase
MLGQAPDIPLLSPLRFAGAFLMSDVSPQPMEGPSHTATFAEAVDLFNRREFFECHEVIELLWKPLPKGPEKRFLQGVLQIAVGLHHLHKGNYAGAKSLLNEGVEKLKNIAAQSVYIPPIALTPFLQASNAALETLIVLGPDCLDEFPEPLIPVILV